MRFDYEKQDELLFQAVDRLKNGDTSSFNDVYELSKKYIYKIIYDVVKDTNAVEDLMQETYLQIYNKINTLENARVFLIWAGRIATNYSLRYIQKKKDIVAADLTSDDGEEFVFDTVADDNEEFIPEEAVMDQEKVRLIGEILDGLSAEQKIAVQFFYYEEMSVRDIAKACNCSEGTIKSRLNYARKAIKEAVVDLEVNKNTKLYSLASLPVFYIVFRKEVLAVVATVIEKFQILESIFGGSKEAASSVEFATKTAENRVTELSSQQVTQSAPQAAQVNGQPAAPQAAQVNAQPAPQQAAQATGQPAPQQAIGQPTAQAPQATGQVAQPTSASTMAGASTGAAGTATAEAGKVVATTAGKAIGTKIAIGATVAVVATAGTIGGLIASGTIKVGKQTESVSESDKKDKNSDKKDKDTKKEDSKKEEASGEGEVTEDLGEYVVDYMYTYGDGIVLRLFGGQDCFTKQNEGVEHAWMYVTMDEDYVKENQIDVKKECESFVSDSIEGFKEGYPDASCHITADISETVDATLKNLYSTMSGHEKISYGKETDADWQWFFGQIPYITFDDDDYTYVAVFESSYTERYLSINDYGNGDIELAFSCGAKVYKVAGDVEKAMEEFLASADSTAN